MSKALRIIFAGGCAGLLGLCSATVGQPADRAHELAGQAAQQTPKRCKNVTTMKACHLKYPTGCNTNGKYDGYLGFLKNQAPDIASASTQTLTEHDFQNIEAKVPGGISSSNHADFANDLADLGEGNIYTVIGYLYFAKQESKEASNCQLTASNAVDFHMWMGFDVQAAAGIRSGDISGADLAPLKQRGIVVEMTPHYRARYHPGWTINKVKGVAGRQVKIVGQLMLDNDHFKPNQDCGIPGADTNSCWRATVWELHPVIEFYVCDSDAPCAEDSSDWKKLDDM